MKEEPYTIEESRRGAGVGVDNGVGKKGVDAGKEEGRATRGMLKVPKVVPVVDVPMTA